MSSLSSDITAEILTSCFLLRTYLTHNNIQTSLDQIHVVVFFEGATWLYPQQ